MQNLRKNVTLHRVLSFCLLLLALGFSFGRRTRRNRLCYGGLSTPEQWYRCQKIKRRRQFRHVRALTTFGRYHSSYLLNFFPRRLDIPRKNWINRKILQSGEPSLLSTCILHCCSTIFLHQAQGIFPQTFTRFRAVSSSHGNLKSLETIWNKTNHFVESGIANLQAAEAVYTKADKRHVVELNVLFTLQVGHFRSRHLNINTL